MPASALPEMSDLKLRVGSDQLADTLHTVFDTPVDRVDITPLQGDASTRQYFRLIPFLGKRGSCPDSVILMQLERPVPEPEIDFTRIRGFLEGLDIPVPRLFHYDTVNGLLYLQDCGDQTLEQALVNSDLEKKRFWYHKAVDLVAHMQFRARSRISPDCPAYHLRFDVEKLSWEMDFMLEHYVKGLLKRELKPGQYRAIREALLNVCQTLEDQETWFTHRDYHSRNLMVFEGELVVIDFQDARMGPCQYDLVSLLRDSYIQLPESLVEELVDRFISLKENHEGKPVDRAEFCRVFDLMSLQRNLKAIGTFAFQTVVRENTRYLENIGPTLEYVRKTLVRQPELEPLRSRLREALPDLNL
jgi:aminoglycoside/choline kinase family phosphotransferase